MVIYFHGWMESTKSQDVFIIREAYKDYNVITVDYSNYAPVNGDASYVIPQLKIVRLQKSFVEHN